MRVALTALAVFILSLLVLGWKVDSTQVASGITDPIVPVYAQDEAPYISSVQTMLSSGHLLTPRILGRLSLAKPPLLLWMSVASVRAFGLSLTAVRLPSVLCGALSIALVFAWVARAQGFPSGAVSGLLLLTSSIWVTFSRVCYTDVVATTAVLLALFVLTLDPRMTRFRTPCLLGLFTGCAILTRSVVGLLPLLTLGLWVILAHPSSKPSLRRILQACAAAFAVALPWYAYQAVIHPEWLWAEAVGHQLVAVGMTQSTGVTGYPFFYVRRLIAMEPVLCLFGLLALFGIYRFAADREPSAAIAVCWTAIAGLSLAVFRGRSVSYLVLLVPALCILAGICLPRIIQRAWPVTILVLLMTFGAKLAYQGAPWGIRFSAPHLPGAAAMRWYHEQNRDRELTLAEPDEQFYSMTLPGMRLRYCFTDPGHTLAATTPHLVSLGIAVSPTQLAGLSDLLPSFRAITRKWGLESDEAIASAVTLERPAQISEVIAARPGSDYYLPAAWMRWIPKYLAGNYETVFSADRVFLLVRGAGKRPVPAPAIPHPW